MMAGVWQWRDAELVKRIAAELLTQMTQTTFGVSLLINHNGGIFSFCETCL